MTVVHRVTAIYRAVKYRFNCTNLQGELNFELLKQITNERVTMNDDSWKIPVGCEIRS